MLDRKEYMKVYHQKPEEKQKARDRAKNHYSEHTEERKKKTRDWVKDNPDYPRKWRAENPDYSKGWQKMSYWDHPTLSKLKAKEIRHLNKIKVVMHYSNPQGSMVCNNCGERDIDVLCIDHINGGGGKHNKILQSQGTNLALWLVKNNYPKGFQVLCSNCNMKKVRFDISRNGNFIPKEINGGQT